ncbi:hypothetical protein HF289_16810 [Acidithiobacillus ferrooxidans]|uniref:hypothetical protein n=1 Tax=Acidithiobacillus ferrooxidans TaxID=920 RepID=UPI001C072850|nr:hypothetical protein [Acidithiobacillus ferrooxidans]MBU2858443.1 hypothetical protein [Acidithiobacillus ferrooxidans]MBU2861873.1 hypothetical protein [Acidithiobacillus ferrooxidans]
MAKNENKYFFGKRCHQDIVTPTEEFLTVLRQGKLVLRDSSATEANLRGLGYGG